VTRHSDRWNTTHLHTLNGAAPKLITGTQIRVNRDANTATVTITGTAIRVLPFLSVPVTVTVSAPVEATTP